MNTETQQKINPAKSYLRRDIDIRISQIENSEQSPSDERYNKIGLTARVLAQQRKQQSNPNYMKKRDEKKKIFDFYSAEDNKTEVRADVKDGKEQTVVEKMLDEGAIDYLLADAMRIYAIVNNSEPEEQLKYKPWWSQVSIKEMIKLGDMSIVHHIYGISD